MYAQSKEQLRTILRTENFGIEIWLLRSMYDLARKLNNECPTNI